MFIRKFILFSFAHAGISAPDGNHRRKIDGHVLGNGFMRFRITRGIAATHVPEGMTF